MCGILDNLNFLLDRYIEYLLCSEILKGDILGNLSKSYLGWGVAAELIGIFKNKFSAVDSSLMLYLKYS